MAENKYDPIVKILTSHGYDLPGMKSKFKSEEDRFWAVVNAIMAFLYKKYPFEMKNIELSAKIERENNDDDYGEFSQDNPIKRKGVTLPSRLDQALTIAYRERGGPPITQKKFIHGMWKRYPSLRLADKF